jgi:hypothetical protein
MIKQVLNQIDISLYAELALVLFSLVFIAVVIRTLLTKSEITDQQAKIVLGDNVEKQA